MLVGARRRPLADCQTVNMHRAGQFPWPNDAGMRARRARHVSVHHTPGKGRGTRPHEVTIRGVQVPARRRGSPRWFSPARGGAVVREEVEYEPCAGLGILPFRLAAELASERRDQFHAEAL